MPAPTALQAVPAPQDQADTVSQGEKRCKYMFTIVQVTDVVNPADIEIQDAENQGNEEFLLGGGGDDEPIDVDAVLPQVKNSEDSMAIDEEGRPRFAPAKDIVRIPPDYLGRALTFYCTGSGN